MSAPSYDFGLEAADVSGKLGIDPTNIGAATKPLKTSDVTDAIASGCAAAINAAYARGVTADADLLTNDPDTHQKLRDLAQAYAVAKLAGDHGKLSDVEQRWYERAMQLHAMLAGAPGEYGAGAQGITTPITSTMDNPQTGDAYEIGGVDWTSDKVF